MADCWAVQTGSLMAEMLDSQLAVLWVDCSVERWVEHSVHCWAEHWAERWVAPTAYSKVVKLAGRKAGWTGNSWAEH